MALDGTRFDDLPKKGKHTKKCKKREISFKISGAVVADEAGVVHRSAFK
jgi:hypothetical protein